MSGVRYHHGGNITSAGWQVTLCDPIWHVSSRSGVATLRTAIHLLPVPPPSLDAAATPSLRHCRPTDGQLFDGRQLLLQGGMGLDRLDSRRLSSSRSSVMRDANAACNEVQTRCDGRYTDRPDSRPSVTVLCSHHSLAHTHTHTSLSSWRGDGAVSAEAWTAAF